MIKLIILNVQYSFLSRGLNIFYLHKFIVYALFLILWRKYRAHRYLNAVARI